jgi:hypothetical protein
MPTILNTLFPGVGNPVVASGETSVKQDPSDTRPPLQFQAETPDAPVTPTAIAAAQQLEGITPPVVSPAAKASTDTTNAVTIAATVNDATTQERVYRRWLAAALANIFDDPQSPGHPQRLGLAGAIMQNGLSRTLLVELVLSNQTNYVNVLNYAATPGGALVDSDIDYAIAKIFPGLAISRNW